MKLSMWASSGSAMQRSMPRASSESATCRSGCGAPTWRCNPTCPTAQAPHNMLNMTHARGRRDSQTKAAEEEIEAKVTALIEQLKDEDFKVRQKAAFGLAKVGRQAKGATSALIQCLADEKQGVRCHAANALRNIIGPEAAHAIPALTKAMKDESGYVRYGAVRALGSIGEAAVPALVKALDQRNVRNAAVFQLGNLGPKAKAVVPALEKLLKDEQDKTFRQAVEATLKKIQEKTPLNTE